MKFCNVIVEANAPYLPHDRIRALRKSLYAGECAPDWIVVFQDLTEASWKRVKDHFVVAAQPDVHPYPTQRPELNLHAFEPLPHRGGVHILRRKGAESPEKTQHP